MNFCKISLLLKSRRASTVISLAVFFWDTFKDSGGPDRCDMRSFSMRAARETAPFLVPSSRSLEVIDHEGRAAER